MDLEVNVMINKNTKFQDILSSDEQKFVRLQFEQAIETLRAEFSLLVQMLTVLILANATLIGYSISTEISGILFLGSIFPIMMIYFTRTIFKTSIPILYIAMSIENKHGGQNTVWGVTTFLSTLISSDYVAKVKKIDSIEDPVKKFSELRSISTPSLGIPGIVFFFLALIQAIAPAILTIFFDWDLF